MMSRQRDDAITERMKQERREKEQQTMTEPRTPGADERAAALADVEPEDMAEWQTDATMRIADEPPAPRPMLVAFITVTVAVSVPNETIAGAMAGEMRSAADRITRDYYQRDGARSSISCDPESGTRAKERAQWQTSGTAKT